MENLTEEEFETLQHGIAYLKENFDCYSNYLVSDFDVPDEYYDEIGTEEVFSLLTPEGDGVDEIKYIDFIRIFPEITSLKISNNEKISTSNRTYFIASTEDEYELYQLSLQEIKVSLKNGIEISFAYEDIVVGFAAIKSGEYNVDYRPPLAAYSAILIDYTNSSIRLSQQEELSLSKSFMFEIAFMTGISLHFSLMQAPEKDWSDDHDYDFDSHIPLLETFNPGMEMFLSATAIREQELKYLNFYKILEHFGPIALKMEGFELMRKKLDLAPYHANDADFIQSVFELSNSIKSRYNDRELIEATIASSIDCIGIFNKLPVSIQKKLKSELKLREINYSVSSKDKKFLIRSLSRILYVTRNMVVHAKANFTRTGDECDLKDLEGLNLFLRFASAQTIKWYNRLPEQFRLSKVEKKINKIE